MSFGKIFGALALAVALLCSLATPAAAEGRWLRAETPHFIFYSDGGERSLRSAAQSIEAFDAVLRRLVPPPAREFESKLEIYLLRNHAALRAVRPGLGEDVAGFYSTQPDLVGAFAIYGGNGALGRQEILFHEYAHHYMLVNFADAYPVWFVEGFAEFVQTVELEGDRAIIGDYSESRAPWLMSGNWLTTEELLTSQHADLSRDDVQRLYAQGWLTVHYLKTNPERAPGLRRYFEALRAGGDALESFTPAFGITPDEFHNELRRYVRGRIPRFEMRVPELAASELIVSRLPESADDLLLPVTRMRSDVPEDERAALSARVEEIAARFPGDAFAQRARARAAIMRGAATEARPLLEPVLAANAEDIEANYLMGLSYMAEAGAVERDQAPAMAAQGRRYFTRAARTDPDHIPSLYRYASSYQYSGAPMPEGAVDVLLKAHLLAPQVTEIALNAGVVLIYLEDYDSAAALLRPIAYAPHGEEQMQARIRALLAAAERHEPPSIEAE